MIEDTEWGLPPDRMFRGATETTRGTTTDVKLFRLQAPVKREW